MGSMPRTLCAVIGAGVALFAAGVPAQPAAQSSGVSFQTFSLWQAVSEAVLRNPNRVRAGHEVTAAGFQRDAAEWARFPTFSVDASPAVSGNRANTGTPSSVARLEQPLWAGGRIDAQIDSARSLVSAAESAEGETRQRLAEQTAVTYVGWMDAAARVDIAANAADLFLGLQRYVRRRESEGLASAADVAIAAARHGNALAQVSELRGALDRARAELASLTLVWSFLRGVPLSVPAFPDSAAAEAERTYLEKSPLAAQRRAEVESARSQVDVRKGQMLPRLALRVEHLSGLNSTPGPSSESRALFVLQFTPEPGLASYSGYQGARSRLDAAVAQLDADENDVRLRARTHLADYAASRVQVSEIEPQVSALDVASGSFARQFEAGRKSWLEVLNTHRETVDAKLALSRARTTRDQSALRLMVNTGTFWPWLDTLPK